MTASASRNFFYRYESFRHLCVAHFAVDADYVKQLVDYHQNGFIRVTRPRLYERIQSMGRRAGVPTARPHRFRDTLAVDMLNRGANPYDVAKMLGDTIETVEKHYMPFVKELRERVRNILETGVGLEELAQKAPERPQITTKKPN
jgi:integrase